jgi:ribonuclease E
LRDLEQRFQITITVMADSAIGAQQPFIIDKGELVHSPEQARLIAAQGPTPETVSVEEPIDDESTPSDADAFTSEAIADADAVAADDESAGTAHAESRDGGKKRRRRRRQTGRNGEDAGEPGPQREEGHAGQAAAGPLAAEAADENGDPEADDAGAREHGGEASTGDENSRRRRRRGRRGGRRNRRERDDGVHADGEHTDEQHVTEAAAADEPPAPLSAEPATFEPAEKAAPPANEPQETTPAPELPQPPAPRRRSTVRERVVLISDSGDISTTTPASPPPEPKSAPETETPQEEDAARPRRTGWWAKRLLGQ